MDAGAPLSLEGWDAVLDPSFVLELAAAQAEVDGDDWGEMPIVDLQAKLEADDDFVILQLETTFATGIPVSGLRVEVNSLGLRTLEVDGVYQVPVKGEAPEGFDRYVVKDVLPAGDHRLLWSYVWNPPKDSSDEPNPDGVTLAGPKIFGARAASTRVAIPAGATALVFDGPAPGDVGVAIDGVDLPMAADAPCRAEVPPGGATDAEVRVAFPCSPVTVTAARWLT